MAIAVKMPQLGESVTEGTVGRWLKQVGDPVEKYEPLLEVISDKVDTEITATDSGTLNSIEVEEGETVPVGTVLCYLAVEEGEEAPAPEEREPATAETAEQPASKVPAEGRPAPPGPAEAPPPPAEEEPAEAEATPEEEAAEEAPMITPVVARMVGEHSIDISEIEGTGRNGRVTKRDVEAYLEQREGAEPAPAPEPEPAPEPAPEPVERRAPEPAPQRPAPKEAPRPAAARPGELVPLTNMRRRIAEHMIESKRTAPHVTTVFEADLSRIAAHRDKNRAEYESRGVRLTFMAYFVEAAAYALCKHPMVNSTFTEEGVQLFKDVNIGMAVATEDGAGLLVPVIRGADEKNLLGLARDVDELTRRARNGELSPDDMSGGTFTLTNHGVSGSLWGTPIINQPQSAIMGIGKIQKRPVVVEGDAIAVRPMIYLSFTFDHRVLDGATADRFMADFVDYVERYSQ